MTKRFKNAVLFVFGALLAALLFFPMIRHGNQPQVPVVTKVGKADSEFIRQLAPHAQRLGKAYGVRPSVLLAQASLETDYGRSLLGAKYRNLYQLTAEQGQGVTVKVAGKGKDKVQLKTYQVYTSWEDSLADYLVRLKAGKLGNKVLYRDLANAESLEEAAQALVDGGYRKDKAYASQVLSLIKEQKLERYDKD